MKLSIITEMKDLMPKECQFQFGDCGLEVYKMAKRAVDRGIYNFIVVDGMVDVGDKIETPHSWIERNGEIIDPTVSQFGDDEVHYSPSGSYRDEFTPIEYIENFEDQYGEQ